MAVCFSISERGSNAPHSEELCKFWMKNQKKPYISTSYQKTNCHAILIIPQYLRRSSRCFVFLPSLVFLSFPQHRQRKKFHLRSRSQVFILCQCQGRSK